MSQLDRYVFGQILGPFGFFALIFTGVIWLMQSLRLIDTVVNSGQSALVFLEFSALLLPTVISIVIPVAALSAALYAVNRLFTESELVVMMMAGQSPFTLLRSALFFGLTVAAFAYVVSLVLMPLSLAKLADRTAEIRTELVGSFIREGVFLHPSPGLTLFINEANTEGEVAGLFLNDERNPEKPVTYSAKKALFLKDGSEARLVMFEGIAQQYAPDEVILNTVRFDKFVYDLTPFLTTTSERHRRPKEYFVTTLINPPQELLEKSIYQKGYYVAEGHQKIVEPLFALLFPVLAMACLLSGTFRRSGYSMRIMIAIGLGVCLWSISLATKSEVNRNPDNWPIAYAAPVLAVLIIAILLRVSALKPVLRARRIEAAR